MNKYINQITLSDEATEYVIRALRLAVYTAKKNASALDTLEQFEDTLSLFTEFQDSLKIGLKG